MPRMARRTTSIGYMHIICRGIGKQVLFEEEMDYKYFLNLLKRFSQECDVTLIAYCLMENHVHLLVNDPGCNISKFMQKLGVTYSGYYNRKYDRSGHLFQDRYLSETVDDEKYLLTVFRYILNNPQKAGICPASAYRWSSYHQFHAARAGHNSIVDTSLLYSLIGGSKAYQEYLQMGSDDQCMEYELSVRDEKWAKSVVHQCLGGKSGTYLQSLGKKERDKYLNLLKRKGLSVRQIERLTGISRSVVHRA